MPSVVNNLIKQNLLTPPKWLADNVMYETMMGSEAYGVASDQSDIDIYGFCIPPKDLTFPHLQGEIPGFGNQIQRFEQFQQHHIEERSSGKQYDITIYSIVKYFQLCMENNPNMLDSLFTPRRCIRHSTQVSEMVLQKREIFLHKGSFHKLRGYAYAQLSKIDSGSNRSNPKRQQDIDKFGYSTKFAYHLIRLILQAEQILMEHTLDIEKNREILKDIRAGNWDMDRIRQFFIDKEKALNEVYLTSTLRIKPNEQEIKQLLIDCLEHHYGSISNAVVLDANFEKLGRDIRTLLDNYNI